MTLSNTLGNMGELTLGQILHHPMDIPMFPLVLFALAVMFVLIMIYMQLKHDPLDLRWLILDRPHRPSLTKVAQIVALAVSTWGFVVLTLSNNLSETYFMAYMTVWSGSAALDAYFNKGARGAQRRTDPTPPDTSEPADQPAPASQVNTKQEDNPSNPYDSDRG
jgi:hypothetical protein